MTIRIIAHGLLMVYATLGSAFELEIGAGSRLPPPPPFSLSLANSSVWYSAASSCGKDSYANRTWTGPSEGFVYKGTISDIESDTQGEFCS